MQTQTALVKKVLIRYYCLMKDIEIYNYIERLSNLLRVDARRGGVEIGLQPIQLEALHYVSICNRYSDTPKAVTEYLGQTKGTVSQTLNVLEKKGLLKKITDSEDKRISHLKITNEGQKLLSDSIPSPLFVSACKQMSEASQSVVVDALDDLLRNIQSSNNMKTFGVCHSCSHNRKKADGNFFCNLTQEDLSTHDVQLICREHLLAS